MATNEFIVRKGLIVNGSGSTVLDIQGSQGQLFSVTDDLTGTLFSVNDISGIPILSVDSDDTVTMGTFGENTLVVTGSRVGIGAENTTSRKVRISGGSEVPLLLDATQDFLLGFARSGTDQWWVKATTGGDLIIHENGVGDKVTFQAGGNVGIGTTTPAYELDVRGSSADSRIYLDDGASGAEIYLRSNGSGEAGLYISSNSRITRAGGDLNIIANAIDMNLSTNNGSTNHLRIDTSGDVTVAQDLFVNDYARIDALRVGTTSTDPGDGNLYVEADVNIGDYMKMISNSNYMGIIGFNRDVDNGNIYNASYGAYQLQNYQGKLILQVYNSSGTQITQHAFDNVGNVGIGTTTPTEKLEVTGNTILDASNANLKIKAGVTGTKGDIQWTFNTDSTVYASAGIEYDNRGTDGFLIDSGYPITMDFASSYIRWRYNGSEKMRLNSSGNLGIGTTSPSFAAGSGLEIERAGIATLRLQNTSTGKSTEITQDTNFEIDTLNSGMDIVLDATTDTIFEIADSEIARINSTGLGIGTTSPDSKLHVSSGDIRITNNSPSIYFYDSDVSNLYHRILGGGNKGLEYSVDPNNVTAGYHRWDIGGSVVMQLIEGGNLGILNTAPGEALTVGDGTADTSVAIKKSDNNVSDHLQFFNGTTRVGEIGTQDDTWLRINQVTSKNIYTPRYIRADGGFFVDSTSYGINGSGRLLSNSLSGTYSNSLGFSGGIDVYGASPAIKARGSDAEIIFQSTNESAGNPNQFYIQHNFGSVDIGNSRGNITFNNGNITITNDLFVDDYARIDALRVGTTSTDPGDGNLYVEGNAQHGGTVGYTSFNSGFGGDGWRIDSSANAEFENLTVRGTFSVYELLAQQIRATNGSLLVATSGKVDTSTGGSTGTLTFDTGNVYGHGFLANDIILAQRLDTGGTSLKRTFLRVDSRVDSGSLTYTVLNGDNPEAGQEFVRIGNTTDTDRQGHIYLTADDNFAPYIGVRDGVNAYTDFTSGTGSVEKVRVGRLDGVTSANFGSLSGYGLWASGSVYLEGGINATFGEIAGWTINTDSISGGDATLASSGNLTLGTSNDVVRLSADDGTYRLWTGHATAGSAPFRVTKGGAVTATSATITGNITAETGYIGTAAAGFDINSSYFANGKTSLTDANAGVYVGTDGISLGASSVFKVEDDGALTATNATITGNITANTGTIGGFTIGSNTLTTTNFTIGDSTQTHAIAAGASNQFTVTHAGAIGATSGEIAGWTLGTSTLSKNNVTLNSAGSISVGSGDNIFIAGSSGIQLGNATFSSAPFRVTQAGALTATSGEVAGWTLGTSTLSKNNVTLDSGGSISVGSGNNIFIAGSSGIQLGNATFSSAPFRVTQAGALTATNATITGAITATNITATTAGNIAGWTVGSDTLSKSGLSLSTAANNIGLKYVVSSKNKIQIGDFATASKTETNLGTTTYYSENETVNGVLSLSTTTLNSNGNVQGDAVSFSSGNAQGYFRIAADLGGKTLEDGESFNIKCSALQPDLSSRTSDTSEAPEFTVRIFDSTGTLVTETKGPTSSIYDLFARTHNFNLTYTNTTGAQKTGVYAEVKIKAYDVDGSAINNLDIEDIVVYKATPKVNITDQQALFYNSPTNYFEWTPSGILIVGSTLTPDSITTGLFTANEASTFNQITTFNNTVTMTSLANKSSEATAVVIDGNDVIGTRELGSNAFNSTTIGTTTNSLTVSTGLDLDSGTTFNGSSAKTITLDLTEVGFGGGANRLVTDDGDGTVTTEANLTYSGTDLSNSGGGYIVDRGATNILLFKGLDSNDDGIQLGVNAGGDPYFAPIENGTTQFSQEFLWDTSADTWVIEDGLQVDGVFEIDPNGAYLYMNTDGNSRNLMRFDRSSSQNWELRLAADGRLELNDINASRTFEMDCIITKRSGTFKIKHPDPAKKETHNLYHSFVESPTAGDNIYRWQVEVVDGTAVVELPDYYKYLNENTQVWVSADEHLGYGFGKINEEETRLTIQTNSDGIYNVLCIGTRKDKDAVEAWTGVERLQSES